MDFMCITNRGKKGDFSPSSLLSPTASPNAAASNFLARILHRKGHFKFTIEDFRNLP